MAYINKTYYDETFKGESMSEADFTYLSQVASDLMDEVAIQDITAVDALTEEVKRATAYQTELLYMEGGKEAILGNADGVGKSSESLGDYSVSKPGTNPSQIAPSIRGIPISQMAISQLRRAGLMKRSWYARSEE